MEPRTIRWGILATGGIAETFTKDLLVDPITRNITSIKHTVVAAASASGPARAQDFLRTVGAPTAAKAYGTYQALASDPNVEIIYVATPHSHHYQHVKLCLEAGKNVLCEKAFTVNAAQAAALVQLARAKDLLLMEALWTRYLPLSVYVRETITAGRLGTLQRVFADNSLDLRPEDNFPRDHRMVSPDLAGGALLDMGIYSLTWLFQTLYTTQIPPSETGSSTLLPPAPRLVASSLQKYQPTGVDEAATVVLTFPRDSAQGGDMLGIATTSFRVANDIDGQGTGGPAVRIQGTQGELQVWPPIFRPTRTRLVLADSTVEDRTWPQPGPGRGSGWYKGYSVAGIGAEGEGYGMFWEADEAAFAIVEGRKEGRALGLDESVLIMQVMDEVRRQNSLVYPAGIEATD